MYSFKITFMKLFISLLITLTVGGISGYATANSIGTWYATLNKPPFNPPNWLFGPVWTLLYVLMGIALYLVWRLPASSAQKTALAVFGFQLLLNFLWSFIFFKFHFIGWALLEIIVLWGAILLTIIVFSHLSKTSSWLLLPYLLWVSFASFLNYTLWNLNG